MSNPFDDQDAKFLVLMNGEGQFSLWPAFAQLPEGWTVSLGECSRDRAVAYVEKHWTDMRPRSLREATGPRTS